jgi:hypothetical protein
MTLQVEKLAIKIFNWAQLSFVNLKAKSQYEAPPQIVKEEKQ